MRLSEVNIQQAEPRLRPYKLTDSGGLCLFVSPHSTKSFRYNYRFNGKRQTLTIGKHPGVSLENARIRHAAAREALAQGINPAQEKRESKKAWRANSHGYRIVTTTEVLLSLQLERTIEACNTLRNQLLQPSCGSRGES